MILISNNFIALIVLYLYQDHIKMDRVYKFIIFSCIILLISFIFVSMGYELSQISGNDVRAIVRASELAEEHKNLFGGGFRIAGYAEDPNYASMFWIIGIIAVIKANMKKRYKVIFMIAFFICFGFSWSKTAVLALVASMAIILLIKLFKFDKNVMKVLNSAILIGIIASIVIMPKVSVLSQYLPTTLTTRFTMWNLASDLFSQNPITGNGIDSFKSYINEQNNRKMVCTMS